MAGLRIRIRIILGSGGTKWSSGGSVYHWSKVRVSLRRIRIRIRIHIKVKSRIRIRIKVTRNRNY
jgi:hypothetical protein